MQQDVTAASPYENANISVYVFLFRAALKSRQFLFTWASDGSTVWRTRQSVVTGIWQKANQTSSVLIMFFVFVIRKNFFFWLLCYLLFKCMTYMTVTAMPQRFCEFSAQNGCEHLTLCRRHCCVGYMCFFPSGGSQSTERRERGACCPRACELLINAALPQQVYSDNLTWWQKCQHESFSLMDLSWNRGQGCLFLIVCQIFLREC